MQVVAEFLEKTARAVELRGSSPASLAWAAEELLRLAKRFWPAPAEYPSAGPAQELMYSLGEDVRQRCALYLVSDAPGTVSPPHEHGTWAVIAGVHGVEVHTLYH